MEATLGTTTSIPAPSLDSRVPPGGAKTLALPAERLDVDRSLPEPTALYAEYCARAGARRLLSASLFDLQVLVETRVGQAIDEAFWHRLLAAPDHLLPNTRRLLVDVAG
jgi:hypothetical protein